MYLYITRVYDDMDVVMGDDVKDKLLTNNEECFMNLINLLAIISVSVYY